MEHRYVSVIRSTNGYGAFKVAHNRTAQIEKETGRWYIILNRKRAYCHFDQKLYIMILDELEEWKE